MSVIIKGSEPFDVMIASNIVNCQTANIKFKNISFQCETIEDADGTVFIKMPSAQPEYLELTPEEAASEIASETLMSAWYWLDGLIRLKQMGYAICRKRQKMI